MRRVVIAAALVAGIAGIVAGCEDGELAGPQPPTGALRFVALDAGYYHTCGLRQDGSAWCWGGNSAGMLGDGTIETRARPTRVTGPSNFVALDAGAGHTCGLDAAGVAWCWGHNDEGQLGDGTRTLRLVPTPVAGGHVFESISAGHAHTCARTAGGEAWCWGDDSAGQLGNGEGDEVPRSLEPSRVLLDQPFADVRAGFYQTCGLTVSGAAYCWGSNSSGQNGDGTDDPRQAPVAVQGDHVFRTISPGEAFVCATDDDDRVFCWGANRWGELGETAPSEERAPIEIEGVEASFVSAASGPHTVGGAFAYACALADDGRARCWGGRVPGLREEGPAPSVLDGDLAFDQIVAAPLFVCGLRRDGYAYCGGEGSSGQLGTGESADRAELVPVAAPE